MSDRSRKIETRSFTARDDAFGIDVLLHPANAFAHPLDIVRDPDLTTNEKRALLASWASDACAVEAAPELRHASGDKSVKFDDVMDALRSLDQADASLRKQIPHYRRVLANWDRGLFGTKPRTRSGSDKGRSLN